MAESCGICVGEKAVSSDLAGTPQADIWCPVCNLEMYLIEMGIVGQARGNGPGDTIRVLEDQLDYYVFQKRMGREEADRLVEQARGLLAQIKASPDLGEGLLKKENQYLVEFKAEQERRYGNG